MASLAAVDVVRREAPAEPPDVERGAGNEIEFTLNVDENPQSWKAGKKCNCRSASVL